jgi:hypothetical protein
MVDPDEAERLYAKRKSAADEIAAIDAKASADAAEAITVRDRAEKEFAEAVEALKQAGNRRTAAHHQVTAVGWRANHARKRPLAFLQKTADGSISALYERIIAACESDKLVGDYASKTAQRKRQLAAREQLKDLWREALTADELADRLERIAQEAGVNW